jgi:tRNA U34 5-methylaminomethyl-2-thiouridine-forming methyltransferase MnmC
VQRSLLNIKFCPIKTNDNSTSLYNIEINDVYHSKVGAYTESLKKYVLPSGIPDFAKDNDIVKILDICYGAGYNSKTAVQEIIKINPKIKIEITALEIDLGVITFSGFLGGEFFDEIVNLKFLESIGNILDIELYIKNYINSYSKIKSELRQKIPKEYEMLNPEEIEGKLHNIYYRNISTRNISPLKPSEYGFDIKVNFLVKDARKIIQSPEKKFDFVFHDPFTPSKDPTLWTVEFFRLIYEKMNATGNLTTYSSAASVRSGLIEAGFHLGVTYPVGKKSTGTIAYKNSLIVKNFLSEKESGLLKTKAGIPYRDKFLNSSKEDIIGLREKEKNSSEKVSSSKFLKKLITY